MTHEPDCPTTWAKRHSADDCPLCKLIRASKAKGDALTLRECLLVMHDDDENAATAELANFDQLNAFIRDINNGRRIAK